MAYYGAPGAPGGYHHPAGGYPMAAPPPSSPYTPGFAPANPAAFAMFQAVDADRSGSISFRELHAALSNGGWSKFSPRTTRLLIKMFDADKTGAGRRRGAARVRARALGIATAPAVSNPPSPHPSHPPPTPPPRHPPWNAGSAGALNYFEFERLVTQLNAWRAWFDAADRDRSGKLDVAEVSSACAHFGFNLAPPLLRLIFSAFDEDVSGQLGFDEFVQLLAELNALTALFRRHDTTGAGVATMDYASFMSIVFATRS
jgi:Ca2+-binding EF-hand superfamily protein